jgi:hypothetical protein
MRCACFIRLFMLPGIMPPGYPPLFDIIFYPLFRFIYLCK